jgi:AAA domain
MSQDSNSIARARGPEGLRDAIDFGAPVNGHLVDVGGTTPWWRDPATIPPREFLYGRHYIRRAIGATIAGGGRGKTTLAVFEAVTMAACFDLVTRDPLPSGPLRVWLLNGEEEQDELDRRVAAVCQRYRVSEADLGGRLFAQSVRDRPMRIAITTKGVAMVDEGVVDQMVSFIERNRIDIFMVDPLVSFHDVPENDNSAMDKVIKQGFGAVAAKTNSAGEVFHHPGKLKPGQAESGVEDGRGASAILWAVRSARVLNFMTPADAERFGISEDDRRRYVRIANGKANMGPIGAAQWVKLEIENLPNGDQIATASSWRPPNPFQDVTTAHMALAAKLAATGEYRADRRSPKWFGYPIAGALGLDISHGTECAAPDIAKIKAIMETWRKNKVFDIEKRTDAEGKKRDFVVAGSYPPPECAILNSTDEEYEVG